MVDLRSGWVDGSEGSHSTKKSKSPALAGPSHERVLLLQGGHYPCGGQGCTVGSSLDGSTHVGDGGGDGGEGRHALPAHGRSVVVLDQQDTVGAAQVGVHATGSDGSHQAVVGDGRRVTGGGAGANTEAVTGDVDLVSAGEDQVHGDKVSTNVWGWIDRSVLYL